MDKLWIVILFLCAFLICSCIVKRFAIKSLNSAESRSAVGVITAEKDDPKVFWEKEGFRREPQQADFELPDTDFFENEKMEFEESFERELENLSYEDVCEILETAGLFEKDDEEK